MAYTTIELAIAEYEKLYGPTEKSAGFSITATYDNYGVRIDKWYQRSSWVDEEIDRSVMLLKGKIYERDNKGKYKKEVGTYTEIE